MEARFGEDFSRVQVERGLSSQDQARGVRAVAEPERIAVDPHTLDGQHEPENQAVLAEELAHIVQKRRGTITADPVDEASGAHGLRNQTPQGEAGQREPLEEEAQHAAREAVAGKAAAIGSGARAPVRQFSLWGTIKGAASWVGNKVSQGTNWVGDKVEGAGSWAADKINQGADWLEDKGGKAADWVGKKANQAADWVGDKVDKGASWVGDKLGKGVSWVGDKLGKGMDWLGNTWLGKGARWLGGKVADGASWVGDKVEKGASWVGDKVGQGASWVGDKVGKGMDWLGNTWLGKGARWLGGQVADGASWVGDKVEKGASWVGDKVGQGASWVGDKVGQGASWVGDKVSQGASWVGDKVGKGMDWLGNTWLGKGARWLGGKVADGASWLGNKAEGGLRWAGDKVGQGVDWLSKSWVGKIGRGLYKPIAALANRTGGLIQKSIGGLEQGIDWVENKVGSSVDWLAKKTANIPVLGALTKLGSEYVKFQSQMTGGFLKGGLDFVGGLANMALHPVDTAKGLYKLAEHLPTIPGLPSPLKVMHNLYDVAAGSKGLKEALNESFNPFKNAADDGKFMLHFGKAFLAPYIQAFKDGKPGEAIGRLGFDLLMLVGTDGAGLTARGTGEGLNAANKLEQGLKLTKQLENTAPVTKGLSESKLVSKIEQSGGKVVDKGKILGETGETEGSLSKVKSTEEPITSPKEELETPPKEESKTTPKEEPGPGQAPSPGEQYKKIKTPEDAPQVYKEDPRFQELVKDPAHGGKVTEQSVKEAMTGLQAEKQGLVKGPIQRGPKEIDFYGGDGVPYDVKTPPSPPPGAKWKFKPKESGDSILKQIRKEFPNQGTGNPEHVKVLLDSSYMEPADRAKLFKYLEENATQEELGRIQELQVELPKNP